MKSLNYRLFEKLKSRNLSVGVQSERDLLKILIVVPVSYKELVICLMSREGSMEQPENYF